MTPNLNTYPWRQPVPYPWQAAEFATHGVDPVRGVLWDMRLGKTRLALDSAAALHESGEIDGLLVIAPNGVHVGWANELDTWMPEGQKRAAMAWRTSQAKTRTTRDGLAALLHDPGLSVLTMSYNASITPAGRAALEAFLKRRRCMSVLDEAHMAKTPRTARTLVSQAIGRRSAYRRILSGTISPNRPWDIYSPYRFLDQDFWKDRGIATYTAFKAHFGVWEVVRRRDGRQYPKPMGYQNLDQIWGMIAPVSTRLTLADVGALVPDVGQVLPFEMPPTWRRHYEDLRRQYRTELANGEVVTAAHALARMTRLQQVSCGHLPGGPLDGPNPRVELAADVVEGSPGQAIVWCRFTADVDAVIAELNRRKVSYVRYDGQVDADVRQAALRAFNEGEARVFVGNPAAGGRGLTLPCPTVVWYSCSFNLEERLQATARARKVGGAGIHVVDLVAEGTLDRKILGALEEKWDISATITGDRLRSWLADGSG